MGREIRRVPADWQHPVRATVQDIADAWPLRATAAAAAMTAEQAREFKRRIDLAQSAAELVQIRKDMDAAIARGSVIDMVPQADGCYGVPRALGTGKFDPNADYIPLFGESYREHAEAWEGEFKLYSQGFSLRPDFDSHDPDGSAFGWWTVYTLVPLPASEMATMERARLRGDDALRAAFSEWHGEKHDPADHMPDWTDAERTHIQMYETCSEGTPISPVCETPEALARWLADNGASAFGGMTASYDEWLATCRAGSCVGMAIAGNGEMMSGPAVVAHGEVMDAVRDAMKPATPLLS